MGKVYGRKAASESEIGYDNGDDPGRDTPGDRARLRGLKEFGEPTRKALIMDLAPEGRKAAMFGLYYLMRDTIVSVAAFGGAGLWLISPEVNFLTAFGFGVAGTAWFVWRGKE